MKRTAGVVGRTLVAQTRMRLSREALGESCRKMGLTDPWLARNQHNLPLAVPGEASALQQKIELMFAADESGQTLRMHRLEAALGSRHAFDRPRRDRLGNTLDLVPAKIAQAEKIAKQPTGGGGDHNRSGLGQGYQRTLPQRAPATKATDHDQAGRDANPNRQRLRGTRLKSRNGGNDIEPCPHGSLSIVFVRARIAEIGQYPVAPKLTNEALIGQHDPGAGGVIGIQHRVHVLRIEAGR